MVIVLIIAILATLWFISFQKYTLSARDAQRVVNVWNIQKSLEEIRLKQWSFPSPEWSILTGSILWENVTFVGNFWKNFIQKLNLQKTWTDPSTQNSYTYAVSHNKKYYQIAATKESEKPTYQSHIVGNYKGILRKKNMVYNLPGLIFTGSGELTSSGTFFVVEKSKNIPYKIDPNTPDNSELTPFLYQYLGSPATGLKTIAIEDWNSQSGSISEELWYPVDKIGYEFFGEEYLVGNTLTAPKKLQCSAIVDTSLWNISEEWWTWHEWVVWDADFQVLGNKLLFSFETQWEWNELWVKDLSSDSPATLLKDINAGGWSSHPTFLKHVNDSYSQEALNINNYLYFNAYTPSTWVELWKTDGTASGTVMMQELFTWATGSRIYSYIPLKNQIVLFVNSSANGVEPYITSATWTGISLLRNIHTGTNSSRKEGMKPHNFKDEIYFNATSSTWTHLWKTNGTSSGTVFLKSNSFIQTYIEYNNELYFFEHDTDEIWKTDGTSSGTILAKSTGLTSMMYPEIINNKMIFLWNDGVIGNEYYSYDFATQNVELLVNANLDEMWNSHPDDPNYGIVNNTLLLALSDGWGGYELWRTDGTASWTYKLDIFTASWWELYTFNPIEKNGKLYFEANDNLQLVESEEEAGTYEYTWRSHQIWETDGTLSGTKKVATWPETLEINSKKYVFWWELFFIWNNYIDDYNWTIDLYKVSWGWIIPQDIPNNFWANIDNYLKISSSRMIGTGEDWSYDPPISTYYQCKY